MPVLFGQMELKSEFLATTAKAPLHRIAEAQHLTRGADSGHSLQEHDSRFNVTNSDVLELNNAV